MLRQVVTLPVHKAKLVQETKKQISEMTSSSAMGEVDSSSEGSPLIEELSPHVREQPVSTESSTHQVRDEFYTFM